MSLKLRIRLPGGEKLCGAGTNDPAKLKAMQAWVQGLKRADRFDVLEMIVHKGIALPDAYRLRDNPDAILAMSGARDIEPYVKRWHIEKVNAKKGAIVAPRYLSQVRVLIPEGKLFRASRLTPLEIRRFLKGLPVDDPTRNRYKAAISSFCHYLVEEGILPRNPVRDVSGFSEGHGKWDYYEMDEAKAVLERIEDPLVAGAVALAIGACFEHQAISRTRVRDIDLSQHLAFANGGKTAWRRRQCRFLVQDAYGRKPLFDFCEPYVAQCLRNKLPDALVFEALNGDDKPILAGIAAAAKAAGVKRLTLHDQRHTHTVGALRAGYSIPVVTNQGGWSTPHLVWTRYGRFVVDQRDYDAKREDRQDAEKVG